MKIKIFTTRITNDADLKRFNDIINTFIEEEINKKDKVVYDIRQTETPPGPNQMVTVLTITISYEDKEK